MDFALALRRAIEVLTDTVRQLEPAALSVLAEEDRDKVVRLKPGGAR